VSRQSGRILVLSLIALLFLAMIAQGEPSRVVSSEEILKKIELGQPVEYDGCTIMGDLDLSGLNLTKVPVKKSLTQKGDMLLPDYGMLVVSPIIITNSIILGSVNLNCIILQNVTSFRNTIFEWSAFMMAARFEEDADFSNAKFYQDAYFDEARFYASTYFHNARFYQDTDFGGARFYDYTDFKYAEFYHNTGFQYADFYQGARFDEADFYQDISFMGAYFDKYASFESVNFHQEAEFAGADFTQDADFYEARFYQDTDF
jgi:uncharacterized protein YjbI with pentapeptide repeats